MDDRYEFDDPWATGVYETGRTRPPKRHTGCVAGLLVVVILLTGVVSLLGFLNVQLAAGLSSDQPEDGDIALEISETAPEETGGDQQPIPTEETLPGGTEPRVELETSPQSVPNVPQEGGMSLQDIYEKNIPSVVSVICTLSGGSSTGTGVVMSGDGYIITNAHVVEGAVSIHVLLTDGGYHEAALVGADSVSDLAVLRIEAAELIPAEFGDSTALKVGDSVAAIGDPLGVELRGTMTNGIVSAINRDVATGGRTLTLIQTNAALNSGNSGGPLINCYGQVVGINTMKIGVFTDSSGVEGIGFAIPSTTVQDIVNQLITQGYVSGRPSLGLTGQTVSTFDQYYFRLPAGLYIDAVEADSPAEALGIEAGDVLVRVGDTRISGADDLEAALYSYEVGDTVTIVIVRNGQYYQADVELTEAKG
ncbi:MAG: trypsin-like peptidase domain-containing protein [Oscillospiraceae bacterium]|nr:trypsin-like peptidase domain-containing protein [Oscillospiraceae bacterium]